MMITELGEAPAIRRPRRRGYFLDCLAFGLGVASWFPAGALLMTFGMAVEDHWNHPPPGDFMTGRRSVFEFFAHPEPLLLCLATMLGSAALSAAALAITRKRRRDGLRLARAAGRMATCGLAIAGLDAAILGALAAYRYLW